MFLHSQEQWETLTSRQSNKDKEIINKTLIVSYFLIFTLVIMVLFMVKNMFFTYGADEAISFNDYVGSIHIGLDTTEGDYYIQNGSDTSANMVYGIRSSEEDKFTVIPYSENQIIKTTNGEHLIVYHANLIPVDSNEDTKVINNTIETKAVAGTAESTEELIDSVATENEGMVKLDNDFYNTPYVFSSQSDDAYYELYDDQLNVLDHRDLTEETIVYLTEQDAAYIKFNNLNASPLTDYTTTGRLEETYFTPAVYTIGKNLEAGNFEIIPSNDDCSYRVIDSVEEVATTELSDCSQLPILLELQDGQIFEVHQATVEKYFGDVNITAADAS